MQSSMFGRGESLKGIANFGGVAGADGFRRICGGPKNFALDADIGGGGVDGGHLGIGGLEADHAAFAVETLEGGVGAVDQSDDDFAFAGGAGALDQNIVAGDDVLVAHGVAADFKGEDFAVADDVRQGDALGGLNGFDGLPAAMRPSSGRRSEPFLPLRAGRTSMERLRLCARCRRPLFCRLVTCLCTVARELRPRPLAISS